MLSEIFQQYDPQQSGVVSRSLCEQHVQARTAQRKQLVLEQYQDFLRLNPGGKPNADVTLMRHETQLQESEARVLDMLQRVDESSTRGIDWEEWSFVEAWWINSNYMDAGVF
jgi:hypothetical protein